MVKLFDHSKVYVIGDDQRGHMGVGNIRSLAYYLADKHGERGNPNGPNTIAKLKQMAQLGYVRHNGTYYIAEKCIPIEIRKEVRNDKLAPSEVIKMLER